MAFQMFTPLQIQHVDLLKKQINQFKSPFSEYSPANLYLFREIHDYQIDSNACTLIGKDRHKRPILIPLDFSCFTGAKVPEIWKELLLAGYTLYPLTLDQCCFLQAQLQTHCEISYEPDESDYIYDRLQLSEMKGRHLSAKRNHIHQLLHTYPDLHTSPLLTSEKPKINRLLESWQHAHQVESDISSLLEALEHLQLLELEGVIIKNNEDIIALSLGERREEMWLFHFAKTHPDYKGASAYLYQQTAQWLPSSLHFLNMEQDMGLPGLRQAKHSFQPSEWLKKYRLRLTGY